MGCFRLQFHLIHLKKIFRNSPRLSLKVWEWPFFSFLSFFFCFEKMRLKIKITYSKRKWVGNFGDDSATYACTVLYLLVFFGENKIVPYVEFSLAVFLKFFRTCVMTAVCLPSSERTGKTKKSSRWAPTSTDEMVVILSSCSWLCISLKHIIYLLLAFL